jgi:hypothetical protein
VIPGIEYEYALVQWALPTISLADMAAAAKTHLGEENRVALVVVPEKPDSPAPAEASIRTALSSAERVAVMPWNDTATTRALLEKIPEPAAVSSRREIPELGITVVRFANGLEAWLKPTDFKNDEILFNMYAPGGASLAAPADFLSASFATRYVGLSGFGGLKRARPRQAAGRQTRGRLPVRVAVNTGHLRRHVAGGLRNGASARLPAVHRARCRPGGVCAHAAPARSVGSRIGDRIRGRFSVSVSSRSIRATTTRHSR